MRMIVAAAVILSSSAAAAAAGAGPAGLTGVWAGDMRQVETNAETTYPMTLTFAGEGATSEYPTLNCGGAWTRVAAEGGYVIYSEKVTNKKGATCIDGMVMVTIDQGKVVLAWFAAYGGEPSVATAKLSKTVK